MKDIILPTPEEATAIRRGDRTLIDRYYTANYQAILVVCRGYCRDHGIRNAFWEDMAHDCYLAFESFNFSNVGLFIACIRQVCNWDRFNGNFMTYLQWYYGDTDFYTILDEPLRGKLEGKSMTLGDSIASDYDLIEEIEPSPDYSDLVHDIAVKYFSPRERDVFDICYYSSMIIKDVAKKLGVTVGCVGKLKNRYINKLRKHAVDFLLSLLSVGFPVYSYIYDSELIKQMKAEGLPPVA